MAAEPPIILWPWGPTARALALRLMEDAARRQAGASAIVLFEPPEDFSRPLMALVAAGAQQERFQAAGVEVRLLISTWEFTGPVGKLLHGVSAVIGAALPGNQSLTLSLLIPPSLACPADLAASWNTLQAVSRAMGKVQFFRSALVMPVLSDLYRPRDDAPSPAAPPPSDPAPVTADADRAPPATVEAGVARPAPAPREGGDQDQTTEPLPTGETLGDLTDFLTRSLLDTDTVRTLHDFGDPLIRDARLLNGEPAGFASLTARRVRYDPSELSRYLHARFQHDLFTRGLFAPERLPEEQRRSLRAQAQALTDQVFGTLSRYAAIPGPWAVPITDGTRATSADASISEQTCEDRHRQAVAAMEQIIRTGEIAIRSSLTDLLTGITSQLRGELETLLDRSPDFLAGAAFLLDCLRGRPAPDQAGGEAGGLIGLERAFRQHPMQEQAAALFHRWFTACLARYQLTLPGTAASTGAGLAPAAQLLSLKANELGSGLGSPARLLVGAWERVQTALAPSVVPAAVGQALLLDVGNEFLNEIAAICRLLATFERDRAALREELKALRRTHPAYKFWQLGTYTKGKHALQERLDTLAQQREQVLAAQTFTLETFQSLANELLWPHEARVLMIDGVRQCHDQLHDAFDRFVGKLRDTWTQQWANAQQIPVTDRWSELSVNSVQRADILYERLLEKPNWSRLVTTALRFVPSVADRTGEPPAYTAFSTLREHYQADAGLLIQRVADLAADLFKPARSLDILDILELPDQTAARHDLAKINRVMDAQPEFASGKLPHAVQQGLCQRQRMIRCTPAIARRLRDTHGHLYGGNDIFLETDDRNGLDLTTFTLGFPASLLHVFTAFAAAADTGKTRARETSDIVIETQHRGASHLVTLTLEGQDDQRLQWPLVVDTGAAHVALPASLIPQLGFSPDQLTVQQVLTANGSVDAAIGTLPAVWLNDQRVPDVTVAFIADDRLGADGLLGMSVLGRFRITIDEEQNHLVLAPL